MADAEGDVNFSIDARAIIQLGRDSIKNPTTALLELVKNSYDADATIVEVAINKDSIRIADNGAGMTREQLLSSWLRIGYSEKRSNKLTGASRRKTGEKGIGRLSTDRLGKMLVLRTHSKESRDTEQLIINWDSFDVDGKDVSDIPIQLSHAKSITLPSSPRSTGTELVVSNLRQEWLRSDVEQAYEELTSLVSPFSGVKDFQIIFSSESYDEFNGAIKSSYYDAAELSIRAEYDGTSQRIAYRIIDKSESSVEEYEKTVTWQQLSQRVTSSSSIGFNNELTCGPATIDILFFSRTNKNPLIASQGFSLTKMREFLNKNVGIKIYRDNVSVKPYGYNNEPSGDWLGLAQRKERDPAAVTRPTYRIASSQLVGAISIGRDLNPQLRDGASREGLVENDAFYDLRALTLACVTLLEQHRHRKAIEVRPDKPTVPIVDQVESYRENLAALKGSLANLQTDIASNDESKVDQSLKEIDELIKKTDEHEKSVDELLYNNRVLSGLATVGIASAVFGHETQTAISLFKTSVNAAKSSLSRKSNPDIDKALSQLEMSLEYARQVSSWGAFGMERVKKDKRMRQAVKVHELIHGIVKEVEDAFKAVNIEIVQDIKDVHAKAFVMDVESIVLNFLTNAYAACSQTAGKRKIRIELRQADSEGAKGFTIKVADSGPGVDDTISKLIWEPLFTTRKDRTGKEEGTGLGLSIVRSTVEELGGNYRVSKDSQLGGALFSVWLPSGIKE